MTDLIVLEAMKRSLGTISWLAVEAVERDPLISRRLETWQYIGIGALAIALVVVVRALSPKVEHALLFATFLSVILIVFFLSG